MTQIENHENRIEEIKQQIEDLREAHLDLQRQRSSVLAQLRSDETDVELVQMKNALDEVIERHAKKLQQTNRFGEPTGLWRDLALANEELQRARDWSCFYQKRILETKDFLERCGGKEALSQAIQRGDALLEYLRTYFHTSRAIESELLAMKRHLNSINELDMYREKLAEFGIYPHCEMKMSDIDRNFMMSRSQREA